MKIFNLEELKTNRFEDSHRPFSSEDYIARTFYVTTNQYRFEVSYMPMAFVMINTVPNQIGPVLERVKEIEFVKEVYMLDGDYDIVAVIKTETEKDFTQTLLNIRTVKDVSSIIFLQTIT
jgi:DNA-binding Lrp family transcriptional regulator